jgi:hypothetical protein
MNEQELEQSFTGWPTGFSADGSWCCSSWLAYAAAAISGKWQLTRFALPDTDDNLRMAQVRASFGGQGWFDLVQHRFDPAHGGANIHWSRLVDLPIAALILLFRPLAGGAVPSG